MNRMPARWAIGSALGTCPQRPGGKELGWGVHSQLSYFDVPQGLVFSEDTICLLGETLRVSFRGESIGAHCQPLMSRELSSSY